jgi:branched-chain amino acid transport system ATP-binding protein
MAEPLLVVENLDVRYDGAVALNGVDMVLDEREFISIVGANGAGKTTLIRAIAGLVAARGSVRYRGHEILGMSNSDICELGIAQVPEGRQIFPSLSVLENLKLGALLKRARAKKTTNLERVCSLFPKLAERRWQKAGTLSGGEQQMLAIGRCMMADPELIMFDEPSLGLSPLITDLMFDIIKNLHLEGIAIALVEQNVEESLRLCERAYVLENGAVVLSGTGHALADNKLVREAYLGL